PFRGADTDLLTDTLKTDKDGTYYLWRERDSLWTVFLSFDHPSRYRLLDMKEQVLVEGTLGEGLDGGHLLVKNGQWSEYYKNGTIKSTGYYAANQPLGYWEYYYPNGVKRKTYQYAKVEWDGREYPLMLGAYEEFYNNGQVKIIGKYTYRIDTVEAEGVVSSGSEPEIEYVPVTKKAGTWYYYRANGEIFKEEKY
ncbi:MAG: hypothetical protein EOP54_12290, partial [Sphingobacteriales bacterium]